MIAWKSFACGAAALCLSSLVASGCGDDVDVSTGLSGASAASANTESSSSGTGTGTSEGSGSTSNSTNDQTTGTPDPTTGGPGTTAPQTTSGPDTTTTGPDTTTGNTTNNTTNPGGCGNGAIDPNEQCDGANLNGFTCESLGNAGGSLACDPVTCTFDTSMCMGGGSGGTSG